MEKSVFKTAAARDKFRAYYGGVLSRFPFAQQYVDTAYGQTFVLTAGQDANPPVVLLHGSCSNSVFWFPEIMALSADYRVYAVDIIGEAGNSSEFRPDLNSDAFAFWLRDVLDALGLETVSLIGNSLGGWMALKFASCFPERVTKLALLASGGLAPIRPEFLQDAEKMRRTDGAEPETSKALGAPEVPKEVLDFINLILESYDPIQSLPLFTDAALLRLTMPVLFIGGENDAIVDTAASAQRLLALLPEPEIHLLPGCGHAVINAMTMIGPFLKGEG